MQRTARSVQKSAPSRALFLLHEFFDNFRQTLPVAPRHAPPPIPPAARAGPACATYIGKINFLARFLLGQPDQDFQADMQSTPFIRSRFLIVAALALPAFALIAGCKSSPATSANANTGGEIATDDAALAARVKAALAADPQLKPLPVSVATYRGVVQLSGYADSEVQIQKALAVARSVPGVQSVSNELHLRPQ
ncbi:BON domain-containing protein [Caballeronia sp. LP003]|nr:BON domain-containing protein [Caballeronia sp. LP003]MDR5786833.1 BON domain-containing protein [Caballeronia sp. LP003]